MTEEIGKEVSIKDFELILEALTVLKDAAHSEREAAEYANQEAVARRSSGREKRAKLLIEFFGDEIKKIRGEKFAKHRKSKKWSRAMEGNYLKLCK